MQHLIKKIIELDKTKKVVIAFITTSLVIIIGIVSYNAINGNYETIKEVKTNIEVTEENNQEKDTQIPQESTESTTSNEEVDNSNKTNTETSSNNQSSNNSNPTNSSPSNDVSTPSNTNPETTTPVTKEYINVNITVVGMGDTMMSGNIKIEKGSTVYIALQNIASNNNKTIKGSSSYIKGIGGLNEMDHGPASGWMYSVNGIKPMESCGTYVLNNGDSVVWNYVNYE